MAKDKSRQPPDRFHDHSSSSWRSNKAYLHIVSSGIKWMEILYFFFLHDFIKNGFWVTMDAEEENVVHQQAAATRPKKGRKKKLCVYGKSSIPMNRRGRYYNLKDRAVVMCCAKFVECSRIMYLVGLLRLP
jgi:hypothetical protein